MAKFRDERNAYTKARDVSGFNIYNIALDIPIAASVFVAFIPYGLCTCDMISFGHFSLEEEGRYYIERLKIRRIKGVAIVLFFFNLRHCRPEKSGP